MYLSFAIHTKTTENVYGTAGIEIGKLITARIVVEIGTSDNTIYGILSPWFMFPREGSSLEITFSLFQNPLFHFRGPMTSDDMILLLVQRNSTQ